MNEERRRLKETDGMLRFYHKRKREIYLIRHGATALNRESGGQDRIRSWKDVPLSPEGEREVADLGQKLKDSGLGILISSDLQRAEATARAVAETTGAQVIASDKFRPWNLGKFIGESSSVVHPTLVNYATRWEYKAVPGGESFNDFHWRVFAGLREFIDRFDGEILGIVTHHRVERLIKSWINAGETPGFLIDFNTMFQHGECTAHAEKIMIDLDSLY